MIDSALQTGAKSTGLRHKYSHRIVWPLLVAALLSVIPAAQAALSSASPFGINTHWEFLDYNDAVDVANARISWARVDFNWADIEPTQGVYNWGPFDQMVINGNIYNGISILATVGKTPQWATDGNAGSGVPRSASYFWNFVYNVVRRYSRDNGGNFVLAYEMWNEPNLSFDGTYSQYVNLILEPGAQALRTALQGSPYQQSLVVGPAVSDAGSYSRKGTTYLNNVLSANGYNLDAISFHCYGTPSGTRDKIRSMVNVCVNRGYGSKPRWLTEYGFRSNNPNEGTQAADINSMNIIMWDQERNLSKTFLYDYTDYPGAAPFGITRIDRSHKPAYDTYRNFIINHGW